MGRHPTTSYGYRPDSGINLGKAAPFSRGKFLEKDLSMSYQEPIFPTVRKIST